IGPVIATVSPNGSPRPCCRRLRGRGYAICVEDRADAAQAGDAVLERLGDPHFDDEAVAHHRVVGGAGGADDVDPRLGEGPREALEQASAIAGVDLQLDLEGGLVASLPADLDKALRRPFQRLQVAAVGAVDGDPAAEADV